MTMIEQEKFRQLLDACRQNDPAACAELVRLYLPLVRIAVRRRLTVVMRTRFDSTDFTQEVWQSFFKLAVNRQAFNCERSLIAYLCEMARMKVLEEYRRHNSQRGGMQRPFIELDLETVPAGDPSPSAAAVGDDEWHRLTAGLPERERAMLQMLREGHTHADTAAAFGLSEKTVQRLLQRLLIARYAPPGTQP